jgi:outer membrane protein W
MAGVVLGCIALVPAVAVADDDNRWYATANIGLGTLGDSTLSFSDGSTTNTAEASYDASFAGGGTIGYQFGNGWSLEGELMYRRNDLEAIDLAGLGSFSGGDFASLGLGVNALYRFNFGDSGKWSGYVGPGVVWLQEIDIDFDSDGQQEISFEGDETALQLKFGARYDFSDRWFAEAGATYLAASGVTMELPADSVQTLESDYDHWTVSAGIGFRF